MSGGRIPVPAPWKLRLWMNKLWGPFVGSGIKVTHVSPDYREMETRMRLKWYNNNAVGTHYGGSLYSMADPFYMVMLLANIGKDHYVWDKSATVEFVAAVKSEVSAKFKLTDEMLEGILEKTKDGKAHYVDFEVSINSVEDNKVVAKVKKTLYVRKKPTENKTSS